MKVRGFQVAPAELEGHLLDHPDVADVCVVGVPDDYSGEVPLAFVVLNNQARERLAKDTDAEHAIKQSIIKVRIPHALLHYYTLTLLITARRRSKGVIQMVEGRS